MARMSKYDALNSRMRGRLPHYLNARSAQGKTPTDISVDILLGYETRVTAETIRAWLRDAETTREDTP